MNELAAQCAVRHGFRTCMVCVVCTKEPATCQRHSVHIREGEEICGANGGGKLTFSPSAPQIIQLNSLYGTISPRAGGGADEIIHGLFDACLLPSSMACSVLPNLAKTTVNKLKTPIIQFILPVYVLYGIAVYEFSCMA